MSKSDVKSRTLVIESQNSKVGTRVLELRSRLLYELCARALT